VRGVRGAVKLSGWHRPSRVAGGARSASSRWGVAAQQRHAADAQISVPLIFNRLCAPLMPGVRALLK
jgi:hypothetical protein